LQHLKEQGASAHRSPIPPDAPLVFFSFAKDAIDQVLDLLQCGLEFFDPPSVIIL
jgi:hypothetical protein